MDIGMRKDKKGSGQNARSPRAEILILAATYVPAQLPVQYHRP